MSTISALQIQGIRSFGPDNGQKVKFFTPVTLIVGQNGCGKTTIIECLRYITAGELPPGCGKGGSFVHDPKLAMESDMRGQIKMRFKSVQGNELIATRSLQVNQKAKTLQCRTLDTCIRRINADGSSDDISSKCIDFEREMVALLSVSKPILDNVIFCHQEDSSWPLDEGKKVKEKFDAIFNATRYIKCLDNIKKLRKTLQDEVKNKTERLKDLELWKKEADTKKQNLKDQENTVAKLTDKKERLKNENIPIAKRLAEIKKIENNLAEIRGSISSRKGKLESLRTAQAELRSGQNEQVKCSDMELRRMIQDFQRDVQNKEKELSTVERNVQEVVRGIRKNLKEIKEVQDSKTNLEFAYKNHVARITQRNNRMEKVTNDYSFSDFTGIKDFDDKKAGNLLRGLEEYIRVEHQKIVSRKKEFEAEENTIQSEIDSLRKKEAALEQDIRSKEKQREDSKNKGRNIKFELERNELEFSASSLDDIKAELSQVEGGIQQQEGKLNIEKAREDIEAIKKSRRDVEHRLEDKKRIVNKMNRQAQARSKLDIHVKERESLEKNVHFIKRKHKDEFEHLFGEIPEENIKNKLDACTSSVRQRSAELREEKDRLNKKKTKLDTRIESHMNQIKKKEEEVRGVEEKVLEICQGQDLDRALMKSKEQKEQLTKERGDLSSSITVLNRFTEKLKQDDCCPLCHRDFGTKDEVDLLIQELEDKVKKVPKKLNEAKVKLQQQEKLYDQMVGLKPLQDQANKTREIVDKMRTETEEDRKEMEKIKTELESNTELLTMTNDDEETARLIQSDVVTMDNNMKTIKRLKDQIEDLKTTLGGGDDEMTMEEAMKQQNDLEEEIKSYRKQESDLQDRLDDHKSELEALRERKHKLSTRELDMRKKLQETETLKEELKKLEKERVTLEEELEKAKEEVTPFRYQIDKKNSEKTRKTGEKEKWIDTENSKLQIVREDHKSVKELQSDIENYVRSDKEKRLKESRQQLGKLEEASRDHEAQKKMLEDDQRQLEKDLSNQKERKRNLDDEKKIRDKEEDAKRLQEEITEIEGSIVDKDEETIRTEKHNLTIKYEEIYSECAKIEGSLRTIDEEVRKLKADLRRKEICDAVKNYKEKFVEKKCTEVAIDDLNKYYVALDTAIMRFHLDKMKTINSIIRELWRTTYKGNDIDYIEIKTDETESQGADKKRTYHYRVVMVKNGIEMDMRSRCSAGQKVLASLIIRMALAETFSSNCGILALDEPTTNLDCENVEALAQALLNIVEKRKHQKSFQLIVITHDFEFLQKLAMKDHLESYFKVSRNERGLSIIRRCDANLLN